MKFGVHVSIVGGIYKAPSRAHELGCECFQMFTRSPRGGDPPPLDEKTVNTFLQECSKYDLRDYYVHTPYFINLASEKENTRSSSISIIREELERSSTLKVKYAMTHIGSAGKQKRSEGIKRVINGLKQILDDENYSTRLLLENTAGQGATIGDTFEELAEILEKVGNPELGVCLDTAHLFAAGYDLRTEETLAETLNKFSSIVGLNRLKLLHGNDSKIGFGDRKDRHEHIGEGKIGTTGFKSIVNHPDLKDLNLIAETPIEKAGDDIKNLKKLKGLKT